MIQCYECFKKCEEFHYGHKLYYTNNSSGGTCDCGDYT